MPIVLRESNKHHFEDKCDMMVNKEKEKLRNVPELINRTLRFLWIVGS